MSQFDFHPLFTMPILAGTSITVFHHFHQEVDLYRQHIWQCNVGFGNSNEGLNKATFFLVIH